MILIMKKLILPIFTVLFVLSVASCQSREERERAEYDKAMNDLEEMIADQDSSKAEDKTQERIDVESVADNLYITKGGGYAACISRVDLDKMISYASENDTEAITALLRSQRCISMDGGIEVYLQSVGGLASVVEIRPKGQEGTVWTVREAIIKK
jgi:hypothetical protein